MTGNDRRHATRLIRASSVRLAFYHGFTAGFDDVARITAPPEPCSRGYQEKDTGNGAEDHQQRFCSL